MMNTVIILTAGVIFVIMMFIVIPGKFIIPHIMIRPTKNSELKSQVESLDYTTKDSVEGPVKLEGYIMNQSNKDNLVIFFGGLDECAAFSVDRFNKIRSDCGLFDGYDIVVMDWPGFGKSEGEACAESLKNAAVRTVRKYQEIYKNVVIMGYSMGTGYATYAASQVQCDELVLIAPYYSAADLINNVIPVFHGLFKNTLSYKLPVYKYAENVSSHTLIIASRDDKKVPINSSLHLAGCFRNGCELEIFDRLSHGQLPTNVNVVSKITKHLEKECLSAA